MAELPIPSTFSVEQSAVVGESVTARGRTSNYAYKSENITLTMCYWTNRGPTQTWLSDKQLCTRVSSKTDHATRNEYICLQRGFSLHLAEFYKI